jgi:hypothetical protein
MKNKYKNIKIIGNRTNDENHTFIDEEKKIFQQSSFPSKKMKTMVRSKMQSIKRKERLTRKRL